MSTREEQIAALREAIDWFEAHPEVPMPIDFNGSGYAQQYGGFDIHLLGSGGDRADAKASLAAIAKALPGTTDKKVGDGSGDDNYFELVGRVAGIRVRAVAYRNDVCERVVTGTREVTEEVPDPTALAAVPTTTVTRTVEDIEWRCTPILAADPAEVTDRAYAERMRELQPNGIPTVAEVQS